MSGMRKIIYLNKRPETTEEWEDVACGVLNFCVTMLTIWAILSVVSILSFFLWAWIWLT